MREISAKRVTETVKELCIEANCNLPEDVRKAINYSREKENWEIGRNVLDKIIENYKIAEENKVPICQDTGLTCVFLEIGQDIHIDGNIADAINEGVRQGYTEGYLRKSCVKDPIHRGNTMDNTPAMIYYDLVSGEELKITVVPKGFGSENMSQVKMLKPSDGLQGVKDFVVKVVEEAGPNACPPVIVGVGIGGTFDKVTLLAKKALLRSLDEKNPDEFYSDLEEELLEKINTLGIGPQGFGGRTTALGVKIEVMGTHIGALPCAVNLNCHVTRHKSSVI